MERLVREGKAIPLCPEELGGLTTPRSPSEIKADSVWSREGCDVSAQYRKGAQAALCIAELYGCRRAILKARSPSCGKGRVYDGSFSGKLVPGNGLTAELFIANGIDVMTEEELEAEGSLD